MKLPCMRHLIAIALLCALALCGAVVPTQAADSALTAIDILLDPDGAMLIQATADNARLRQNYPHGFALDAAHTPHITVLQRFVFTKDLDKVFAAVKEVGLVQNPVGMELKTTGYYYMPFKGLGLAGINIAPTPELLKYQQAIVDAVAPYCAQGGTAAAFVQNADGTPIHEALAPYVNGFVPHHVGKDYSPHVTIGLGQEDFLKQMKDAPYIPFTFKVAGVSVYQLGDFGTAVKRLWQDQASEPLASWNDTASKKSIIAFVEQVSKEGSPDFVPVADRIAVFDNDGTLWAEQPMYFQVLFALDRVKALAPQHPEWKETEPFASLLKGDVKGALSGGEPAIVKILMTTHAGMTTEAFEKIVNDWITTARHPKTGRLYTEMVYQPMLELLAYLRANGFKTFIVSGGGIEFMRAWAQKVYGIPSEQIVGSSIKTKFEMRDGKPVLVRLPELNFNDDKDGKPVGIQMHIGRRPLAAFGNSDGDLQMLEWTTAGSGARFGLIVHHTDAEREWAYDRTSFIGRLDKAWDEARAKNWTVVDMKQDWKRVFPFEP